MFSATDILSESILLVDLYSLSLANMDALSLASTALADCDADAISLFSTDNDSLATAESDNKVLFWMETDSSIFAVSSAGSFFAVSSPVATISFSALGLIPVSCIAIIASSALLFAKTPRFILLEGLSFVLSLTLSLTLSDCDATSLDILSAELLSNSAAITTSAP